MNMVGYFFNTREKKTEKNTQACLWNMRGSLPLLWKFRVEACLELPTNLWILQAESCLELPENYLNIAGISLCACNCLEICEIARQKPDGNCLQII